MGQIVKIKSIEELTHDVLKIVAEKPQGLEFIPGQAVDVSINKGGWEKEIRPFTFTSQPEDDEIEFNIKTYTDHSGVTNELRTLKAGDELIIGEVFGYINYRGEGTFIAGGAGFTPFISILKMLDKKHEIGNNRLIYANKTRKDIIREEEFKQILGDKFVNILSEEEAQGYQHGYVSPELIKENYDGEGKYVYICGPKPMQEALKKQLKEIGVADEFIIYEK